MSSQQLTTVQNNCFGVAGNRNVTVPWVYLERVKGVGQPVFDRGA